MHWTIPSIGLLILWACWLGQALFGWLNVRHFENRLRKHLRYGVDEQEWDASAPQLLLIVPIKGADEHCHSHVFSLLNQAYPAYRLILVVESEDDPAYAVIREELDQADRAAGLRGAELIVAGRTGDCGQKVWNLLCALERMREDDDRVVFTDADVVPGEHWLKRMSWAVSRRDFGVGTGYRWFVPDDDALPSRLISVINASVLTLLGPNWRNKAWGGAMAVQREAIYESRLIEYWHGALSDDYQLSRAMRDANLRIYFTPLCVVASPVRYGWRAMLSFGRRQYLITRVHEPIMWWAALGITALYISGWCSAVAGLAMGSAWAAVVLGAVVSLDALRGFGRLRIARRLFNAATYNRLWRFRYLECFATPLWMAVHLAIVLSSAVGRTLRWGGITYRLHGPQNVTVLHRDETPPAHQKSEA